MSQYPQRIGEPDCRDFLRTGRCKYGDSCKYHHPIGGIKPPLDPNEPLFPVRPDEPPCQYYLKNGTCKFGQTCKFHHPPHILNSRSRSSSMGGGGMIGSSPSLTSAVCPVVPVTKLSLENIGASELNGHIPTTATHSDVGLMLPQRPSEPHCIYFLKHGRCKYGSTCKYHHPANVHVNVNVMTESQINTASRFTSNMSVSQIQSHGNNTSRSTHNSHVNANMPPLGRVLQSQIVGERERSLSNVSLATNDVRVDMQGGVNNNAFNGTPSSAPSVIRIPSGNPYQAAAALQLDQQQQHNPQIYRRVVDSVPISQHQSQSQRHEGLDTISNSYHLYPLPQSHQQQHQQPQHPQAHQPIDIPISNQSQQLLHQRFYGQTDTLTPGSGTHGSSGSLATSPKLTSPSPTSSTLASSYDTTVSNLEKLPPSLMHHQNGAIPRNNSVSISINHSRKNSLDDGIDTGSVSGTDQYNASSHGTTRISNVHHYMQAVQTTTGGGSINRFSMSQAQDGGDPRFSSEMSSLHSSSSLNQLNTSSSTHLSNASDRRPPIGNMNGRKGVGANNLNIKASKTVDSNRDVDAGLSMMTSALLTMLDTPREGSNSGEFDFETRGQALDISNSSISIRSPGQNRLPNNIQINMNSSNQRSRGDSPSGGIQEIGGLKGTGGSLLQGLEGRRRSTGSLSVSGQGPMPSLSCINLPDLSSPEPFGIQPKPSGRQPRYPQPQPQRARNYNLNMNFSNGNGNFVNYPSTNRDEANGSVNGMNIGISSMGNIGNSTHNQPQQQQLPNYQQQMNLSGHSIGGNNVNGYGLGSGSSYAHPNKGMQSDVPLSPSNPIVQNGAQENAHYWPMSTNPTTDTATTSASTQFYMSP